MRSPKFALAVLLIVLAGANVWFAYVRSGVPPELRGTIEKIEVRPEKHPGLDDVHLVTVGGTTVHLDSEVASALREGDIVQKAAWATAWDTPRGKIELGPSLDARRLGIGMPLLVLLGLFLLYARRRVPSEPSP